MREPPEVVSGRGRSKAPVRVFLVEGQDFVRQGLRGLLDTQGLEVVGVCATAREASHRIVAAGTHVAVLNVLLPDGTGIEVCRDARSADPAIRCLILTSYADEEALQGIVLAGAAGYVLRELRKPHLEEAIRRAAAGELLMSPDVLGSAKADLLTASMDPTFDELTDAQEDVLSLITQGRSNRQISEALVLPESTVRDHVSALLAKLGLGGNARPRTTT